MTIAIIILAVFVILEFYAIMYLRKEIKVTMNVVDVLLLDVAKLTGNDELIALMNEMEEVAKIVEGKK